MAIAEPNVLVSGKTSFKVEVPYKLIETGTEGAKKPLILYLHGYGQNLKTFEKRCSPFYELEAYHLFIQGPYPIFEQPNNRNVSDWGRAWYLYDGNRGQFIKSLELASEFIQETVDNLLKFIDVNRFCIIGYSMGGYLAGYFALTRWKHVNELVVTGGRIKTEIISDDWEKLKHINVLAIHGKDDESVSFKPQKEEIDKLIEKGLNAELQLLDENHSFTTPYIKNILSWLKEIGYN
jgi:predicted esterase